MVTKSRLRLAIAAEKGVDFRKLKEKKTHKAALKLKRNKARVEKPGGAPLEDEGDNADAEGNAEERQEANSAEEEAAREQSEAEGEDKVDDDEDGDSDDDDDEEEETNNLNLDAVDDSDTSESSIEFEKRPPRQAPVHSQQQPNADEDEEDEEDEDEDDIPVSDLEDLDDEDKEDLIPHTRLTINNTSGLKAALDRIAIPTAKPVPFAFHQSVVASVNTADAIPDVSDDLQRELALYSQCLEAVRHGRARLLAEGVPFSRPRDYFAEMVKEDAHMDKVKAKLVEEASAKKAAAEARKLRDLKKFGKQVQVAKLQERQKAKRETLDKIKTLKRKRQESGADLGTNEADVFDVGVDNEMAKHAQRSGTGKPARHAGGAHTPNSKRQKKNEKYGFGGKKRHAKSGDAVSSGDLSAFSAKKMKAGGGIKAKGAKAPRLGKARRKAMATR